MIELYTPGHHEVTDTLIMYGLVKVLKSVDPFLNLRIRSLGISYTVELYKDSINPDDLINITLKELKKVVKTMKREKEIGEKLSELKKRKVETPSELKIIFTILHQKSPATLDLNPINSKRLVNNVEELLNIINKDNIISIYTNHKKVRKNCGSRKGGKGASLPILPIGGNFPKRYTMCEYCQALAWIGLYNFAIRFVYRDKAVVGIFTFEDYAKDIDILLLNNFAELVSTGKIWKDTTLRALPFIILSVGETPMAFSTYSWKFIGYTLGGEGKAAAIRNYGSFNISSLLLFFEKAKIYSFNVARLVEELCKSSDGMIAISTLSEAIIYQDIDRLYAAIRQIRNVLAQEGNERLLDEGLIKAAFEVLVH